ncbi:MAG: DUF4316 domain-containing protein [Butyrivibrio sp.]|uniref:helix-turn-helix domain-containing protein n=1 Tax=Butyrivibrio sp. TaxID=28121 RepID=UPI001B6426F0|nr:hypothetical protein [Butyrivibrio sp.]MBP3782281.1 DUF4316 domain-containing protein [Butyrivibrio sp.]
MERRTGTPIEKWDDVNGVVPAAPQHMEQSADTNDMTQGERFIQLRESTGMSRKEFADYLDIPYRTMQDWERDVRIMPAYVFSLIEYKVRAEFGMKLPQELDPNTLGNVRRGLEDQIEQNDNSLDGIINNIKANESADKFRDDNCNGIPDEEEIRERHEKVAEKAEKTSLLKQLRDCKPASEDLPRRRFAPELVL